jgi:hypothetical protein
LELAEAALAILALILGAFFTSLFIVLRKKEEIRRLVIRYVEIIVFIGLASLLILLGEERLKNALLCSYNNVAIFSLGIPIILYICGFAVMGIMIFEVLNALKDNPRGKTHKKVKRTEKRKLTPEQGGQ